MARRTCTLPFLIFALFMLITYISRKRVNLPKHKPTIEINHISTGWYVIKYHLLHKFFSYYNIPSTTHNFFKYINNRKPRHLIQKMTSLENSPAFPFFLFTRVLMKLDMWKSIKYTSDEFLGSNQTKDILFGCCLFGCIGCPIMCYLIAVSYFTRSRLLRPTIRITQGEGTKI